MQAKGAHQKNERIDQRLRKPHAFVLRKTTTQCAQVVKQFLRTVVSGQSAERRFQDIGIRYCLTRSVHQASMHTDHESPIEFKLEMRTKKLLRAGAHFCEI